MLDAAQQELLAQRLNTVLNQIHQIRGLVKRGADCIPLLQRLADAETKLAAVKTVVLKHHAAGCLPHALAGDEREFRAQLGELVDIFDRFS